MNQSGDNYPRVLLIYQNRINKADQHGISIRKWFEDWPKDKLAQIYSGGEEGEDCYCGHNFKLQQNERRFGKLFFKIKGSSLGESSSQITLKDDIKNVEKISSIRLFKNKLGNFLINTGLWEVIFKPQISKELEGFLDEFKPQIIYCQGYNLTFTWLPVMIARNYDIPICFQTGDDWLASLYNNTSISFLIRPFVNKAIRSLLKNSSANLANGKLMAEVYFKRYNEKFEPVMMCDSLSRFQEAQERRIVNDNVTSIIYSGNLTNDRWVAFTQLSAACEKISKNGQEIMITIFASWIPPEAINPLKLLNNVQILPAPSHDELPSYLKGADILVLAEPFDSEKVERIKLSISTKVHLYMFSERPALIYASKDSGTMHYAESVNWGHRIFKEDIESLSNAINKITDDKIYKTKLIADGLSIALENHDENRVKNQFLSILNATLLNSKTKN